jgi:hypothetical protein
VQDVGWNNRNVARSAQPALVADPHDDLAADDPEHLITEMGVHRTAAVAGGQTPAHHHQPLQTIRTSSNDVKTGTVGELEGLEVRHVPRPRISTGKAQILQPRPQRAMLSHQDYSGRRALCNAWEDGDELAGGTS